jgi:hypothetical protein
MTTCRSSSSMLSATTLSSYKVAENTIAPSDRYLSTRVAGTRGRAAHQPRQDQIPLGAQLQQRLARRRRQRDSRRRLQLAPVPRLADHNLTPSSSPAPPSSEPPATSSPSLTDRDGLILPQIARRSSQATNKLCGRCRRSVPPSGRAGCCQAGAVSHTPLAP